MGTREEAGRGKGDGQAWVSHAQCRKSSADCTVGQLWWQWLTSVRVFQSNSRSGGACLQSSPEAEACGSP